MRSTRVKWVIALAVVTSAFWLMGVMYVLTYKPEVYVNPGTVTTTPPAIYSPSSTPIKVYTPARSYGWHHYSHSWSSSRVHMPSATIQSTGGLYLTSQAKVNSVGGGANSGIYTTSHNSSASRGIQYSTSNAAIPQANFIALASSRQMATPEAAHAPQMAKLAAGPNNAPGPPNPPGPLPEDQQLVEHQPIGDALIPLLLLALAYGAYRVIRNKKTRLV